MKPFHVSLSTAVAMAAAIASALPTYNDAVIFGKVTLLSMPSADNAYLSVTIPTTAGATDDQGYGVRIWDLGTVQCGGVYDSFHNGGPGYFSVQNTGNYPAYVYVATGRKVVIYRNGSPGSANVLLSNLRNNRYDLEPSAWIQNDPMEEFGYKLAVSTDVTAITPTWRPLSWVEGNDDNASRFFDGTTLMCTGSSYYFGGTEVYPSSRPPCAFLAFMPVGETQLFDLKFWAPTDGAMDGDCWFPVIIEAQAFKLWDHE